MRLKISCLQNLTDQLFKMLTSSIQRILFYLFFLLFFQCRYLFADVGGGILTLCFLQCSVVPYIGHKPEFDSLRVKKNQSLSRLFYIRERPVFILITSKPPDSSLEGKSHPLLFCNNRVLHGKFVILNDRITTLADCFFLWVKCCSLYCTSAL